MRLTNLKVVLPLILLAVFATVSSIAYPRLAAEHGDACKSCHINPTGGGARTEFGNYTTALNELTLPHTKGIMAKRYRKPRIGESLLLGFDARYLVLDDGRLFRMQTDAYLTLEPLKNMFYHFRFGESGISENYALMTFADEKYSARFGRFYPSFGLHNDDHQAFVRAKSGLSPQLYLDGAAVGVEQFGLNLSAEIYRLGDHGIYVLHGYRSGTLGAFGYLAGGSLRLSEEKNRSTGQLPNARALFGGLSYGRFTALGEIDFTGKRSDSVIIYGALYSRIEYGLWFVGEYNFFDGDRDIADGVDEFVRFSAEFYPIPFVELRPSLTYYTRGFRNNEHEWFLQVHAGY